jgi:hypothetical protein
MVAGVGSAAAGVVADTVSRDSGLPYAVAADYSGFASFELEDPGSLDALSNLSLTLGPTGFLMTGNSAWSGSGTPQIVVVTTAAPSDAAAVPEPAPGVLCAVALLLLFRLLSRGQGELQGLQLPVKIQKFRRR